MTEQTLEYQLVIDDHPSLAGHFPGNPLLPGAVILDELSQWLSEQGLSVNGLSQAKFLSPLRPKQPARARFVLQSTRVDFSLTAEADDQLICKGRFSINE